MQQIGGHGDLEASGDGSLIAITKRLRTLLGVLTSGLNTNGSDYSMPTTTAPARAVGRGKFYLAGSGVITLGVAGNMRFLIRNPAGSGRTIYIARLAGMATATVFGTVHINPTAGLPSGSRTVNNALLAGGGVAAVGLLDADQSATTALSGGDTGLAIGFPVNNRVSIDLPPLVLSPGASMGININFTGGASVSLSCYWWEV